MWVDNTEFCWTREDVKIAPSRNQNDIGRRTTLSTSFWSSMIFVRTPLRVFTIGPDQNLNSEKLNHGGPSYAIAPSTARCVGCWRPTAWLGRRDSNLCIRNRAR